MCLSIPKQVVAWEGDGDFAWVERDGRRERVNMMLVGPQPLGSWVLTALGMARETIGEAERALIEEALAALASALAGDYDPDHHFADLPSARDE
jgi:hydrogenase expression/formation protein HypC